MWFDTKKEILEYLGKNGNSVRSLERLIAKGLVIEKDGMYASRNDIVKSNLRKAKDRCLELEEIIDRMLGWFYKFYSSKGGKEVNSEQEFKAMAYGKFWYYPSNKKVEEKERESDRGWIGTADDWVWDN